MWWPKKHLPGKKCVLGTGEGHREHLWLFWAEQRWRGDVVPCTVLHLIECFGVWETTKHCGLTANASFFCSLQLEDKGVTGKACTWAVGAQSCGLWGDPSLAQTFNICEFVNSGYSLFYSVVLFLEAKEMSAIIEMSGSVAGPLLRVGMTFWVFPLLVSSLCLNIHLWGTEYFPFTQILYQKRGFSYWTKWFRLAIVHFQEMLNTINNMSKIKFTYHNERKKNEVY